MTRKQATTLMGIPFFLFIIFTAWALKPVTPDPDYTPREIRTHTVQPYDTYWKIAKMYYPEHDPRYIVDLLREWNPWYPPEALRVGHTIYLPEVKSR